MTAPLEVLVPFGTRPEIVKLAPVVAALRRRGLDVTVAATGQHADPSLTEVFYAELGLRPDVTATLDGDPAQRLGGLLTTAARTVQAVAPDVVLLLGDTNTVPAYCLAARAARVPVAHLEAGLRSFNETSMEEVNRRVAAATASLHLAPTALAARFLAAEGVAPERVRVVGNPVIDLLRARGVRGLPLEQRRGAVVTAHRATNVDDPARLAELVRLLAGLGERLAPVLLPLHPRTRRRLEEAGLLERVAALPGVQVRDPLPYAAMLDAMARCRVVVSDSGGLQEEASWLGVPVVVLRTSTPRWEGVATGAAVLTGLDADRALDAAVAAAGPERQRLVAGLPCPYGDGTTGEQVADLLLDPAVRPLLDLAEPDFVGKPAPVGGPA